MNTVIHTHTDVSHCSSNSFAQIIDACQEYDIDAVAITDHNTILGAINLKKIAPKWLKIIVGEEISTNDGEVIGLFLQERINGRGRTLKSVIKDIKSQGGLVMIPHPFDKIRREAIQDSDLIKEVSSDIDLWEVFNARSLFGSNKKSKEFFNQKNFENVVACIGADAHFPYEFANASVEMDDFSDPTTFKENYKNSKILVQQSAGLIPLVLSKIKKMISKR